MFCVDEPFACAASFVIVSDIVVMTGDLVEGSVATLGQAARPLYSLHAKQGKFFVSGMMNSAAINLLLSVLEVYIIVH